MSYLEQFSRKKRQQEKTEVLTARLPKSLYSQFKQYTDELGLSISEAVCLLVEREIRESQPTKTVDQPKMTTLTNTKTSTNIITDEDEDDGFVVKLNTNTVKRKQTNTARFTTKPWQVNGELPCPYCKQWVSASNFSRHAKQHATTTQDIFTDEKYLAIVEKMIQAKTKVHSN